MDLLDIVHGVLDVAGFVPAFGAVPDVINAAIYAAEGDWVGAGISLVSAVPGAGDVAGLAGKGVKAGLKEAGDASEAAVKSSSKVKSESAVTKTEQMAIHIGATGGKLIDGAQISDELKKLLDKVIEILNKKKNNNKEKSCFTEDTLVCTNFGFRPIKEVHKGDDIYSRNEKTGETRLRKVEEVICTEAHTIYHIFLDGREEIKTTAYHPVFVKEKGWVSVINLCEGDLIETMEGAAQITKIVKVRHEEPVEVYNLQVEEWESYFVSERQVYVHNCGDSNYNEAKTGAAEFLSTEGDIGTYKELTDAGHRKDNITAHHMPSKEYMEQEHIGVHRDDGMSMNMEMPFPGRGGRHRQTWTCGRMSEEEKNFYFSLSPRDALAFDLIDVIRIYQSEGLYSEIRPHLLAYIKECQKRMPQFFGK